MSKAGPNWEQKLNEAARIYTRLREAPGERDLEKERDAFLARGEDERRAFAQIDKIWLAGGPKKKSGLGPLVGLIALIGAAWLAYEPARIALVADIRAGETPVETPLASGDIAVVDASSALADDSGGAMRRVEVLSGAAFFEVEASERPFIVALQDVEIEVIGTAFETAVLGEEVAVAVAKGKVVVRRGREEWRLSIGDRLIIRSDGAAWIDQIPSEFVGAWREDRLIVDGMTLAQVAEVLDRRIPGDVMIFGDALKETRISGRFDLAAPLEALRILAATADARVRSAAPIATVITGN